MNTLYNDCCPNQLIWMRRKELLLNALSFTDVTALEIRDGREAT
jgi:hypothetical protein